MQRIRLIEELAEHIHAQTAPHPLRVAIDGVDAAGKTILANELVAPLQRRGRTVIRASIDGFHNPRQVRYQRGADSPEGYYLDSFNYPLLLQSLLAPLGPGGSQQYRTAAFDFRQDAPLDTPWQQAPEDTILLFEGVFLLRPELRSYWDFKIFVDVNFEISVERACRRDVILFGSAEATRRRYQTRYVPGQRLYLAACSPKGQADLVVVNHDPEAPLLCQVRQTQTADLIEIADLDKEAFSPYGTVEAPEIFAARLAAYPQGFLVVEVDQQIAGYGCCEKWGRMRQPELGKNPAETHDSDGQILCITGMAVRIAYRGLGFGLLLLDRLIDFARREKCTQIVLETTHAQGLYRKRGFEITGERVERGGVLSIMELFL